MCFHVGKRLCALFQEPTWLGNSSVKDCAGVLEIRVSGIISVKQFSVAGHVFGLPSVDDVGRVSIEGYSRFSPVASWGCFSWYCP